MEESEYIKNKKKIKKKCSYNSILKHDKNKKVKKIFKNEMIIYKEPKFVPVGYGSYQRYDVKKVDDFSDKIKNISLYDYKKAHAHLDKDYFNKIDNYNTEENKRTLESIILERKKLNDYLINNK